MNWTMVVIAVIGLLAMEHSVASYLDGQVDARTIPLRQGNLTSVSDMLKRLIPENADQFVLSLDTKIGPDNRDTFTLQSVGDKISVKGTSAIALSMGIHYYLKYYCKAHISWSGNQLRIPQPLPEVQSPVTVTSQDKYRYYQNVCTVSYSMVWWDWSRWEREIDWMALNGINLPLAFTAQEAIWRRVFLNYGFTDQEINQYFTGPAFLAWNRMGNLQTFGGPLSPSWHSKTIALQKLILERMREFGMNPIAPAFAGRVLQSFNRIFPNASVTQNSPWGKFKPPYTSTTILSPEDPLFVEIGSRFLEMYEQEFGLDHFYSADLFNEMDPPTNDTTYLRNCGQALFQALTTVDKKAIWVMQGWLFVHDPAYWKPPQARAILTSVPLGRMIVLDLEAEFHPQYSNFESFYGQPFIWSIIHNYGGVEGLYGSFDAINKGPFQGRLYPNSSMIGTGITPEGIERNDIMYDLMNEMAWRDGPVNIDQWIFNFTERRYGKSDPKITTAWKYLKRSVYNANGNFKNHGKYIFNTRPSLSKHPFIWYNSSDMIEALELYTEVTDSELVNQDLFRHDLVDFHRQVLQLMLDSVYFNMTSAYRKGDLTRTEEFGNLIQFLLNDMEFLLSLDNRFLLHPWLNSAASWADTPEEEELYLFNARNQITLWGPAGEIIDYANKQWSGIISCYVRPRWELFSSMLKKSLKLGTKFDQNQYNTLVFSSVEQPFTLGNCSDCPYHFGDPVGNAKMFLTRYQTEVRSLPDLRKVRRSRSGARLQRLRNKNKQRHVQPLS